MTLLERARLGARLTRQQLAEKSGVSFSVIYRAETGRGGLGDESLFKLADALGVEPVDLRERAAA